MHILHKPSLWGQRLRSIRFWILTGLFFLIPLFILPFSLDVHEINKQTLLVIGVCLATLACLGVQMIEKRVTYKRGSLNLIVLALLVTIFCSAWFSDAPFLSWVGSSKQEYTSFVSFVAYSILFFLVVNIMKNAKERATLYFWMILSALLSGALGFFVMMGVSFFSFELADAQVFTTVGTINAFVIYLVTMTVLATGLFLYHSKHTPVLPEGKMGIATRVLVFLLMIQAFLVLLLVNYWMLWLLFIIGLVILSLLALSRKHAFSYSFKFVLPVLLIVASFAFLWIPSPFTATVPAEVTPGFSESQSILVSTLETEGYWFGSGPGTYAFDFARYHSEDLNASTFWNTRFNHGFSFVQTVVPTMGLATTIVFAGFVLLLLFKAGKASLWGRGGSFLASMNPLFAAWLILCLSFFLFSANTTLLFLFFGLFRHFLD